MFYYAAEVASLGACSLLYSAIKSISTTTERWIISSPLSTHGASSRIQSLYPSSDYIPGARDVATPYGNMPFTSTASKTLLAQSYFSTASARPASRSPTLPLASQTKGYRVMLLDLFGRGWSEAPGDLRYDDRLYTSQLFIALASSRLNWTGGTGSSFGIVGYSMGAAIVANFTSWFPALVQRLGPPSASRVHSARAP